MQEGESEQRSTGAGPGPGSKAAAAASETVASSQGQFQENERFSPTASGSLDLSVLQAMPPWAPLMHAYAFVALTACDATVSEAAAAEAAATLARYAERWALDTLAAAFDCVAETLFSLPALPNTVSNTVSNVPIPRDHSISSSSNSAGLPAIMGLPARPGAGGWDTASAAATARGNASHLPAAANAVSAANLQSQPQRNPGAHRVDSQPRSHNIRSPHTSLATLHSRGSTAVTLPRVTPAAAYDRLLARLAAHLPAATALLATHYAALGEMRLQTLVTSLVSLAQHVDARGAAAGVAALQQLATALGVDSAGIDAQGWRVLQRALLTVSRADCVPGVFVHADCANRTSTFASTPADGAVSSPPAAVTTTTTLDTHSRVRNAAPASATPAYPPAHPNKGAGTPATEAYPPVHPDKDDGTPDGLGAAADCARRAGDAGTCGAAATGQSSGVHYGGDASSPGVGDASSPGAPGFAAAQEGAVEPVAQLAAAREAPERLRLRCVTTVLVQRTIADVLTHSGARMPPSVSLNLLSALHASVDRAAAFNRDATLQSAARLALGLTLASPPPSELAMSPPPQVALSIPASVDASPRGRASAHRRFDRTAFLDDANRGDEGVEPDASRTDADSPQRSSASQSPRHSSQSPRHSSDAASPSSSQAHAPQTDRAATRSSQPPAARENGIPIGMKQNPNGKQNPNDGKQSAAAAVTESPLLHATMRLTVGDDSESAESTAGGQLPALVRQESEGGVLLIAAYLHIIRICRSAAHNGSVPGSAHNTSSSAHKAYNAHDAHATAGGAHGDSNTLPTATQGGAPRVAACQDGSAVAGADSCGHSGDSAVDLVRVTVAERLGAAKEAEARLTELCRAIIERSAAECVRTERCDWRAAVHAPLLCAALRAFYSISGPNLVAELKSILPGLCRLMCSAQLTVRCTLADVLDQVVWPAIADKLPGS